MSVFGFVRLIACLALCLAVGFLGSRTTYPEIAGWYTSLLKPSWVPPNSVFPVVWTVLYVMMAMSIWLVWERAPESTAKFTTVMLFAVQLILNSAWPPVFFALHQTRIALVVISGLSIAIAATIAAAWHVQRTAALLLVPYLLWVIYATALNASIVMLNR
jgi:translocator protein